MADGIAPRCAADAPGYKAVVQVNQGIEHEEYDHQSQKHRDQGLHPALLQRAAGRAHLGQSPHFLTSLLGIRRQRQIAPQAQFCLGQNLLVAEAGDASQLPHIGSNHHPGYVSIACEGYRALRGTRRIAQVDDERSGIFILHDAVIADRAFLPQLEGISGNVAPCRAEPKAERSGLVILQRVVFVGLGKCELDRFAAARGEDLHFVQGARETLGPQRLARPRQNGDEQQAKQGGQTRRKFTA